MRLPQNPTQSEGLKSKVAPHGRSNGCATIMEKIYLSTIYVNKIGFIDDYIYLKYV